MANQTLTASGRVLTATLSTTVADRVEVQGGVPSVTISNLSPSVVAYITGPFYTVGAVVTAVAAAAGTRPILPNNRIIVRGLDASTGSAFFSIVGSASPYSFYAGADENDDSSPVIVVASGGAVPAGTVPGTVVIVLP